MTGGNNRETILRVAFTLLIFLFLGVGAIDPCSEALENIAVNEGDLDTFIPYTASSTVAKWMATPVTDELFSVPIENYNEADYALNHTGLRIKNATTDKLSTAGYYTVECGGKRFSFKFLVVRLPECSHENVGNSGVQVTCRAIYADSTYDPIAAIFTLYGADGRNITSLSPQRTNNDAYTWLSTVTFPPDYSNGNPTYRCGLTFGQPTEVQDPSVAMNEPKFNQTVCCKKKGKTQCD